MAERLEITQELCRKVQVMLAGTTTAEVASLLNIGESTVRRIRQANFSLEEYARIRNARKEYKMQNAEPLAEGKKYPGKKKLTEVVEDKEPEQIAMDMEERKPASYQEALDKYAQEFNLDERDKKWMRFEAGQVEKICTLLSRIDDRLAQLLRRLDNGNTCNCKRPDQGKAAAEEERSGH